jgi:membrane-bound lytic murein transglycosylase D
MIRSSLTLLALLAALLAAMSAHADDGSSLRTRYFSYPPPVVAELGPGLSPLVIVAPTVDRSRAYLLDITETEIEGRPPRVIRNVWDRVRHGFAFPPLKGPLVAEREHWYRQRKDLVEGITHKARRYLYHIVEAVERRGLPMELALLPFVESGFEPQALSSAQAAGLWQFIPGTAQKYRLRLTEHYDARRDIVASTEAALDYLEFLHGMFNDWQLALAGYNWGEEAVLRAIQRNQAKGLPTNYESLTIPEETRYYVPKLMAIRNIVAEPEKHGIELADIENAAYFSRVDVAVELDAQAVARLAGLSVSEVLALNPSHKSPIISGKGRPAVLLPANRVEEFSSRLSALPVKIKAGGKRLVPKPARSAVVGMGPPKGVAL